MMNRHLCWGHFLGCIPKARNLLSNCLWLFILFLSSNTNIRLCYLLWWWCKCRRHLYLLLLHLMEGPLHLSNSNAFFKVTKCNLKLCFLVISKIMHEVALKLFLQIFLSQQILHLLLQQKLFMSFHRSILAHSLNHNSSIVIERFFKHLLQTCWNTISLLDSFWQSQVMKCLFSFNQLLFCKLLKLNISLPLTTQQKLMIQLLSRCGSLKLRHYI